MAVLTGPEYVAAPNPILPRYGLLQVATGPLALPVHARTGGLNYETATCVIPQGYAIACSGTTKTFSAGLTTVTGNPFVVFSSLTCGSVGLDEATMQRALVDRLKASEQAVVEAIFSEGTFGQSPSLANNAGAAQLTAAANVVAAFGAMESWLYARYGLPGIIHVPAVAAASVLSNVLVWKDGAVWRTGMGTAVSFGNYVGKNAAGSAPSSGHTNFYITGQVAVYRTPDPDIFVSGMDGALNRTSNQVKGLAEREYVVTLDCHVAAIDVTL